MHKVSVVILVLSSVSILGGCHTDIVCTDELKLITRKCVYVEPINTKNPQIGLVMKSVLEKEFLRKNFELCSKDDATIFISGSAFLTDRSVASENLFGASAFASEAIESVSLTVKGRNGKILASASYDNSKRYTASKIGKELGKALASKIK